MKPLQHKLRWLIVAGSTVGFLGSWGLLEHAGKPVTDTVTTNPDPVVVPAAPQKLPPIDFRSLEATNGSAQSIQPLPALPQMPSFFSRPRLRSGGS